MVRLLLAIVVACTLAPLAALAQDAPENDPDTCKELWEKIGLPQYAKPDGRETTYVCHSRYLVLHNNDAKQPDWVLEHLTREQITGKNKRPQMKFQPDPALPEDKRAVDKDYTNSKFDRGHQAPSDDFKADRDWMVESFFLSNIVPQVGAGFNRDIWKNFEDHVRDVVRSRGELYVITGPVYRSDDGDGSFTISTKQNTCGHTIAVKPPKKIAICGAAAKCDNGVEVPAALFKIVYDPKIKRANAFIMPNINHRDTKDFDDPFDYIKKFQVTVRVVQRFTGLEFFGDLPARARKPITDQCTVAFGH